MVPEFGGTVQLQGFGIGDFIRCLAERTKGVSNDYQAPWTSSLQVDLVGQDNQNVDVDIPFDATLESLALTTSTAHKEEKAKEKSTAEGDDPLFLAPKLRCPRGPTSSSRIRTSALGSSGNGRSSLLLTSPRWSNVILASWSDGGRAEIVVTTSYFVSIFQS
jgi:hypothetical protein